MISVTELRAGATYKEDGQLLQVVSYEHIKMGRGSANIKVKVKNLKTGSTVEKSYINGAKVDNVHVLKKDLQFLYKDDEKAYFMNNATYEQVEVLLVTVSDHQFLKEGETFNVSFLGDEALTVTLPPKMVFKVVDTAPGIKGNSATNVFKDATLENNIQTKVPLFINIGESIKIDTRTGSYSEKAT